VRRIESFADDLVVWPGRVSSRVALLLRATERKPAASLVEFGNIPLHLRAESLEHQPKGGGVYKTCSIYRQVITAYSDCCLLLLLQTNYAYAALTKI
jgi:hypothetical protein